MHLFLILSLIIVSNVEVTELEGLLVSGNDTEPVTDLVLLQELLGEVLEVTLGESNVSDNGDLVISRTRDSDGFTEVVGTAINLDTVVKVLFLHIIIVLMGIIQTCRVLTYESSSIENLVVSGTGTVDNELGLLDSRGGSLDGSHFLYRNEEEDSIIHY
jgi:hypothetical protein